MALGSNTEMSFLHTNDLQLAQNGEFDLDYGILVKTVEVDGLQTENKLKKNNKRTSLKYQATGCSF